MTCDLHIHSNYSDGTWSVENIVDYAIKQKLTHIAISDHDTISGIKPALNYAKDKIEIIPAVEINSLYSFDSINHDLHILGYFIDINNKNLLKQLEFHRQARYRQSKKILENIASISSNLKIDIDTITDLSIGQSIGTAHLTKAILKLLPGNSLESVYAEFINSKSKYYVIRDILPTLEVIDTINKANGIAVLAHPMYLGHNLRKSLPIFKKYGLSGIEVFHPNHSNNLCKYYFDMAKEFNLLATGGSDCHGPYNEFEPSLGKISINMANLNRLKNLI